MDKTDRMILRALQRDGRKKIAELADEVGLSSTPCARRVANLERDGVIEGYSARVDPATVGLGITVFINLELERQTSAEIEKFRQRVSVFEEVMECHLMTGNQDILMRVVARDLEGFNDFMQFKLMTVPNLSNIRSSFTLRPLVVRRALPIT